MIKSSATHRCIIKVYNLTKSSQSILIILGLSCVIGLSWWLSYYGFPFNDESFPLATSLRFVNGQIPFKDDLSPYIGIGLFLAPFIKLSLLLHQGTNELVLFMRQLFIAFTMLGALRIYYVTKQYWDTALAFFTACMLIVYHPFGINNFHYDTMAEVLWPLILFSLVNFVRKPDSSKIAYIIFSLLSCLLCLIYPTFAPFLLALYVACHCWIKDKFIFWFTNVVVGSLVAALFLGLLFGYYKITGVDILHAKEFSSQLFALSTTEHGLIGKIITVFSHLVHAYWKYIICSFLLVGSAALFKKNWFTLLVLGVLFLLPLTGMSFAQIYFPDIFYYFNCIGLLGPIIYWLLYQPAGEDKKLFNILFLASLAAGFLISVTSYNLDLNFNIGFFPATLLGFFIAYLTIKQCYPKRFYQYSVLIYGLLLTAFFQWNAIYAVSDRGIDIYKNAEVYDTKGALYGLYFHPYWMKIAEDLQQDLAKLDTNEKTFVYFGAFSVGYLLVNHLKPGEYLLFSPYNLNHFGAAVRFPNITIDLSRSLGLPDDHIKAYLSGGAYRKIITKQYYDIYQG